MKKYEVILDIINKSITFFLRYYMHLNMPLFFIFLKSKRIEIICKAKYKDMIPNCIPKKRLENFLSIT